MTNVDYIQRALVTEAKDYEAVVKRYTPQIARIDHAVRGIATETGELLDMLKKHINYGKDFDRVNAIEEVGDVFWYLAIICDELGISFEEAQRINIRKLKKRYGEKYSNEKAINRDVSAERALLETEAELESRRRAEMEKARQYEGVLSSYRSE